MTTRTPCPECSGTDLYLHDDISTKGGYGPDLLPGTSGVFSYAKMQAIVCKGCGFIRFFASREALAKVSDERGWRKLP